MATRRVFTREFKVEVEAVKLVRDRGVSVAQAARELGVHENVLARQFEASAPNQKWVADFTYLWTAEGWLYVAIVLDLYSRRAVGWSMSQGGCLRLHRDVLQSKLEALDAGVAQLCSV